MGALFDHYQYRAGRNSYNSQDWAADNGQAYLNFQGKRVMFDLLVKDVMDLKKALTLPPETTVSEAAKMMVKKGAGAVMVVEEDHLIGIFTERDALFRVIARGLDASSTRLDSVMTAEPKTVSPGMSYGYALLIMQENGFRHAPVVENGKPIGIVGSRNALDPELEEFASEANRREHIRQELLASQRQST